MTEAPFEATADPFTRALALIDMEPVGEVTDEQVIAELAELYSADLTRLELADTMLLEPAAPRVTEAVSSWHAAASITALFRDADARYPGRAKQSDGILGNAAHAARASMHNPDRTVGGSRYGVVRAGDVTTTSLKGAAAHVEYIAAVLAAEFANRVDRLYYLIHKIPGRPSMIWSRTTKWEPRLYHGPNPHDKHAHHSIMLTAAAENDTSPWFLPRTVQKEDDMPLTDSDVQKIATATAAKLLTGSDQLDNSNGRFTGNAENKDVTPATALEVLGARTRDISRVLASSAKSSEAQQQQIVKTLGELTQTLGKLSASLDRIEATLGKASAP